MRRCDAHEAFTVRLGFVFAAIAAPGLFVTVVKRLIGRARPFIGGDADPFLYLPFGWRPDYASLPSGHATNVFAALVAVGLVWPRARGVMLVYALTIAASRVIVMHGGKIAQDLRSMPGGGNNSHAR